MGWGPPVGRMPMRSGSGSGSKAGLPCLRHGDEVLAQADKERAQGRPPKQWCIQTGCCCSGKETRMGLAVARGCIQTDENPWAAAEA